MNYCKLYLLMSLCSCDKMLKPIQVTTFIAQSFHTARQSVVQHELFEQELLQAMKISHYSLHSSLRYGLGRPYGPWAGPPMGLGWAGIVRNAWALDGLGIEFQNCMKSASRENDLY